MFSPGDVIKITPILLTEKGEAFLPLGNIIIIVKDARVGETCWIRIKDVRKIDNWVIVEGEKIK